MIKIRNNNIYYTDGDSFKIEIYGNSAFSVGAKLRFQVTKNECSKPVLEKEVMLNEFGFFTLELTSEEHSRLELEDYIYRMTVINLDGNIDTQMSGSLYVKWGV